MHLMALEPDAAAGNGMHFGRQEDAHEFLNRLLTVCIEAAVDARGGSRSLELRSQETTLFHHIFGAYALNQLQCQVRRALLPLSLDLATPGLAADVRTASSEMRRSDPCASDAARAASQMRKHAYTALASWDLTRSELAAAASQCLNLPQGRVQACGFRRKRFQAELGLSLQVTEESRDLETCLEHYFTDELMAGGNQWACDGCKGKVDCVNSWRLETAPNVLIVTLKRFDPTTLRKIARVLPFPAELDLDRYKARRAL